VSLPFDATLKHLVEGYALDWVRRFGLPDAERVEVIDADLSTVTAGADRVLRVERPGPCLVHLEVQSSRDESLARRMLKYNVLLYDRFQVPVISVALLLRPEANASNLTGLLEVSPPVGPAYLGFRYRVVRLWQELPESILSSGIGTLPLVPLTNVAEEALPEFVRTMAGRLRTEAQPEEAKSLWTSLYVLMGLRYPEDFVTRLLQGVSDMQESTTYQKILMDGMTEGIARGMQRGEALGKVVQAQTIILRQGSKRFGPTDPATRTAIEAIEDLDRLNMLAERLLDVTSWAELLREP